MIAILSQAMSYPADFKPGRSVVVHDLLGSSMWAEGEVVYIYPKPGIQHDIHIAKEQTKVFQQKIVEKGKQYALICDIRHTNPIDKQCRDYYSSDGPAQNVSAFSFLVDSKFSMVMANFFLGLTTLKVKVKMFTSTSQALSWSKNHVVQ